MSEELYRKVQKGKAVRYELYRDSKPKLAEVDSERVFSILATMLISFQSTIAEQFPVHSRKCRELEKSSAAIASLAALHHMPLTAEDVTIGVNVWRAAIQELQLQFGG